MKVYKYLPISDGSKAVLSDGTLKFNSFNEFNDPFDCITSYDVDASMEYYKTRKDLFKTIGDSLQLSPAKLILHKKKMLHGIRKSIESGQLHIDVISQVGICCFSLRSDNILMWSHYAQNHQGFVIEFDIDINDQNANVNNTEKTLIGYEVEYQPDMPKIKSGNEDFESLRDIFLTKSKDWEYEREYRVITTHIGAGIYPFNRDLISRIIVGVKISDTDYEELKMLVSTLATQIGKKIPIIKAKMVKGKYQLTTT